ncbi:MAG: methyltransferase domain-containing protein [Pseudomonadota bacterium]
MHLDVVELRRFYDSTRLGALVRRVLSERLRTLWTDTRGLTVAGYGFAAPVLTPYLPEATRTLCLMPGQQGVVPWPDASANHAILVEETLWPLPADFVDLLVVLHGLETCERPAALLAEIWRVLAPGGSAVFVVPNRTGVWARREGTPFGLGRPYTTTQLERTLEAERFAAERHTGALYMPPSHAAFWMSMGPTFERIGRRLDLQRLAGVTLVEARKQVYITRQSGLRERARVPLRVLEGLAPQPAPPKPAAGRLATDVSRGLTGRVGGEITGRVIAWPGPVPQSTPSNT